MLSFPQGFFGGTGSYAPVSNHVPSFSASGPFTIAEDVANAASVGTVIADANDAGQSISYSIEAGNGDGVFAINSSSGAITIADNSSVNYETTTSYTLTIRATDNGSPVEYAQTDVTINVTNVVELPMNTVLPVISGTPQEDETLSVTNGTWTSESALSYGYQWQRDGVDISGATAASYSLVTADVGSAIRCIVSASNAEGSNNATTAATGTIAAAGGGSSAPVASLLFDSGSSQYLSMSHSDWGSYDRSQFSFICAFYYTGGATHPILAGKGSSSSTGEWYVRIIDGGTLRVGFHDGVAHRFTNASIPSYATNTWFAIKVDYDGNQATVSNRVKVAINNSDMSLSVHGSTPSSVQNGADIMTIGAWSNPLSYFDGLIYQPTFVSGYNPTNAEVFDGTSGGLKDLSGLSGAYSLLDASSATNDAIHSNSWSNNNSVSTSATIPA